MILTEQYAIGHIGKTGGRALQHIWSAAGIDFQLSKYSKHDPLNSSPSYKRSMYALTIRRLPQREMSWNHEFNKGEQFHRVRTADEIIDLHPGENELQRMVEGVTISHWLRCEHLITDAERFIQEMHDVCLHIDPTMIPTFSLTYDHDIWSFYTRKQVRDLYAASPGWTHVERMVYGDLMISEAGDDID